MRILVCGGRYYSDRATLFSFLDQLEQDRGPIRGVIHGASSGADTLAREWQFIRAMAQYAEAAANRARDGKDRRRGILYTPDLWACGYPAAWDDLETPPVVLRYTRHGKPYNAAAGGIRNRYMLTHGRPQLVVAFPGGPGTRGMIHEARKASVEVIEV